MLVVANKFVLLDFPRTATFSITRMLEKYFTTEWYGFCAPYTMIPKSYQNLRKIAFVRNPVDWYASLFFSAIGQIRTTENVYRHVLKNVTPDECIRLLLEPTPYEIDAALDWYTPPRIVETMQLNERRAWRIPPSYYENNWKTLFTWKIVDLFEGMMDDVLLLRYEDMHEVLPQVMVDMLGADLSLYRAYVNTMPKYGARLQNTKLLPKTEEMIRRYDEHWMTEFDYS